MKTIKFYTLCSLALVFFTLNTFAQDEMEPREKWDLVSMKGTVTTINAETREITLMGEKGELHTVTAGEEVKRFNEIGVNDIVTFDYYRYMKAEFRAPTAEEIEEPLVVVAEAGKATPESAPAGAIGAMVKAVVTIEVLNRPNMVATVKGPGGNYVSIEMEDKELITKLHIGQVVILTYGEAIAISLTKVKAAE